MRDFLTRDPWPGFLQARGEVGLLSADGEPVVESGWQGIEDGKGNAGYVLSKYLIDPAGMSIRMRRKRGKWRLTGIATYCD